MTTPESAHMSQPQPRARTILANWGPTIVFNVVLPLLTYYTLTSHAVPSVVALLASGGWPVVEFGVSFALNRHLDEFAGLALVFIALGVAAGLGFNSARLVLVKESAVTGLFGIVALGSLILPRPLMFYFGRKFATNGTPEAVAYWNGLWQYPSFRHNQRVITIVWGIAFISEALLRIQLSYTLPIAVMAAVSHILPFVVLAALILWTFSYGRRARAAALAAASQQIDGIAPAVQSGP
jgi:hypothetical protein